jgi:hypothetical protein
LVLLPMMREAFGQSDLEKQVVNLARSKITTVARRSEIFQAVEGAESKCGHLPWRPWESRGDR